MDDQVASAFGTILQTGLLGAAIIILSAVIAFLFRELNKERSQHKLEFSTERTTKDAAHKVELDGLNAQIRTMEAARLIDLRDLYSARHTDSEKIHKQMLEVVQQCTTVMESTSASLDGHKDATVEHQKAQREAAEELRKLAGLLVSLSEELRNRFRTR